MKNTFKSVAIAIILALAVSSALAQQTAPPPGDHLQHHFAMMTKHLELTEAQQQQATTLFNNMVTAQKTIQNNMKAAHESLAAAIKANNAGAIDQAAATIGNLTTQQISNHAKAMAAFFQILTPEQQAKFTEMQNEHGGFGGPEGHGFHGPPGAHSGKPQSE